jgi:hypothetical protein
MSHEITLEGVKEEPLEGLETISIVFVLSGREGGEA